jgi:hypothetical protein
VGHVPAKAGEGLQGFRFTDHDDLTELTVTRIASKAAQEVDGLVHLPSTLAVEPLSSPFVFVTVSQGSQLHAASSTNL